MSLIKLSTEINPTFQWKTETKDSSEQMFQIVLETLGAWAGKNSDLNFVNVISSPQLDWIFPREIMMCPSVPVTVPVTVSNTEEH